MKRALVIYDGDCGICEKFRWLLEMLDWLNRFECHPLQNHDVYKEYPITPEDCEAELKLITNTRKVYGGADAVIRICFKLPLVAPVGWLFWLPPLRQFARWLYPIVANNRYRISAQCGLEKPNNLKAKFDQDDKSKI